MTMNNFRETESGDLCKDFISYFYNCYYFLKALQHHWILLHLLVYVILEAIYYSECCQQLNDIFMFVNFRQSNNIWHSSGAIHWARNQRKHVLDLNSNFDGNNLSGENICQRPGRCRVTYDPLWIYIGRTGGR